MSISTHPPHILLVTGSVEGGKTSYLSALVDLLKDKGVNVGGFLCPGIFEQGKRSDFVLENIGDGKQVRMATSRKSEGWIPYRRFYFNPEAFRQGKEWISLCLQGKPQVVVIDEVGPMEMEDSGWWEVLDTLKYSGVPLQLWSVRERLLDEVGKRWNIPVEQVLRIEQVDLEEAAEHIAEKVKQIEE